jgi:nitrilase
MFKKEQNAFSLDRLKNFIMSVELEFKIDRIDEYNYYRVIKDSFMADCCCFFSSIDEFLEHGIGYIIERDGEGRNGSLYCTTLFFDPSGNLTAKHRKLKPTGLERFVWGEGDGSTLSVVDTPYGKMGSLICWENYMPLARTAMYSKGVTLYLAPTADSREEWQCTIRHIALEGRCFVFSCNQFVTKDMYPTDLCYYDDLKSQPEIMCPGGSAIVDPLGKYVVEPVYNREEILIADLDLDLVVQSRLDFDAVGHYARPDVFELIIHE